MHENVSVLKHAVRKTDREIQPGTYWIDNFGAIACPVNFVLIPGERTVAVH